MKRLKTILLFLLFPLAGFAIWNFGFRTEQESVSLTASKPSYGAIARSVTATGTLQPVDTVAVGSQVSGTIKNIYADFNSVVKKGQLLAELDRSLLDANVSQVEAGLAEARSGAAFQQSNFSRQKQLYQVGAISRSDYDAALNQYNTANAAVKSVEAQLQSARRNLSYTKIYAPINGVVLSRSVNTGQIVAASFSTPTLFTIAKDITRMQVQARVDEADIGNIKKGQRATFTVDAFLNETFEGTVEEIRLSPSVSSNVVTYTTLISASNPDQKLKPGMTATITVYTSEDGHALLIPAKSLQFNPDSSLAKQYKIEPLSAPNKEAGANGLAMVWVRNGNELIQKKIKTGLNDNTRVQILEGLSEQDEVVTAVSAATKTSAVAGPVSSPFMPKRPGSSNSKSTGAPK
jgi:HlyD family secretion protein